MLRSRLFLFGLIPTLLFGCANHAPKPEAPVLPTDNAFSSAVPGFRADTQAWWLTELPSPLSAQVENMLSANTNVGLATQDVAIQRARLQEAEARRGLGVEGSASAGVQTNNGDRSSSAAAGIDARLPLDLFDRLQNSRDAAAFDLARSLAELEQARLDAVRQFLLSHIEAAEAYQLQQLLQEQIETAQTLLRLTEFRFSQGLVSSVDVLQQREQLASLKQQPAAVQLRMRQALSQLAVQQGKLPVEVDQPPRSLPQLDEQFAVSSPAALLQRRPDLLAKRAALLASDKRYAQALSAHLPDASLSAGALLRLASGDPSAIFNAAVDAAVNLFDGGALDAQTTAQRADLQRAGVDYLASWLAAVQETDDLLQSLKSNGERLALSDERSRVASDLFEATRRRYERGVSDYLPVLAALRSLQQQQRDHLALQAERLRLVVRLHSAMGLPKAYANKIPEEEAPR